MVHVSRVFCSRAWCSGNVLTIEDAEGFLERLDLLLPPRHAVLVADAGVHAGGLELLVVRQGGVKLLLRAVKVRLLLLEGLLLVLLLPRLVLDVLRFLGLVNRGVAHELVVLLLCLCLGSTCLRLKPCKIRLDHLNHANHTSILGTHTLVGLIKDLRLLHQGSSLCSLGIELFEHTECLGNGGLGILGILDSHSVFCLLLLADTSGLCHRGIKLCNGLGELSDFFRQLGNRSLQLINLRMEGLYGLCLLLARLLIGRELSVTPALVLGFLIGLLHQLHNQILDHLLDLLERIVGHTHGKGREHTAVDPRCLALQICGHTELIWILGDGSELCKRALGLHQSWQMLLCCTGHCTTGQDLNCFLNCGNLFRPELLPCGEVRRLLLASCREIRQVLGVIITRRCCVLKVTLRVSCGLQCLCLCLRLLSAGSGCLANLRFQVLRKHLKGVAGICLLLLEVSALVLELACKFCQHVHNALCLELVGVCLRRGNSKVLIVGVLRQECINDPLGLCRDDAGG